MKIKTEPKVRMIGSDSHYFDAEAIEEPEEDAAIISKQVHTFSFLI